MPSGVRRRKHARSSISKNTRRLKKNQKKVRILSNPIIAEAWDPTLTLKQNYKNLGLTARIARASGGVEKDIDAAENGESGTKRSSNDGAGFAPIVPVKEGRIVKDEDGNVRVVYDQASEDDEDEEWEGIQDDDGATTEVVRKLEDLAKSGVSKPATQSHGEVEWIEKLVQKHGDDYDAMFWDKKLNIYQQSRGDLKRRIFKWKKARGEI